MWKIILEDYYKDHHKHKSGCKYEWCTLKKYTTPNMTVLDISKA